MCQFLPDLNILTMLIFLDQMMNYKCAAIDHFYILHIPKSLLYRHASLNLEQEVL